ncbi:hypothetical protein ACN38_g3116 [Penicillium nordicum]|uniref:Uncharacterized protein n=1 Tax=Penicillium nordicum TaxID=229535 RepID=A0A0M9WIC5_9EURO|nr:hypothetical protein ACN38_g3116 [Penicillium nordicum]
MFVESENPFPSDWPIHRPTLHKAIESFLKASASITPGTVARLSEPSKPFGYYNRGATTRVSIPPSQAGIPAPESTGQSQSQPSSNNYQRSSDSLARPPTEVPATPVSDTVHKEPQAVPRQKPNKPITTRANRYPTYP